MTYFIFSDKLKYIDLYRSDLLKLLMQDVRNLKKYGILELNIIQILRLIITIYKTRNLRIVSSNLRSNLFALIFFPLTDKRIILNGMGRHRKKRLFRILVIILLRINSRSSVVVQNYLDYRFLRYKKVKNILLIMGSGGVVRQIGDKDIMFVTREDKIDLQIPALRSFLGAALLSTPQLVNVVGMKSKNYLPEQIESCGYVKQDDILRFGSKFLQLYGYGEGFPHSLADAIVSGMEIHIHKSQAIELGILRYQTEYSEKDGWLVFHANNILKSKVSRLNLDEKYRNWIDASI